MMKRRSCLLLIPTLFCLAIGNATAAEGPLKVFILAGQSNMQGHAHVSTFDAMDLDPNTAPLLKRMRNADGSPRVLEKVWISSIGSADEEQVGRLTAGFGASGRGPRIGPEFTFGIYMQELLDEPILIIKTAWGGRSLHTDFRPPSAGPYEFNEAQLAGFENQGRDLESIRADKAAATGQSYRQMIEHVQHVLADIPRVVPDDASSQGYELAGFVWFQGWNDMVDQGTYPNRAQPGGYDRYSELLTDFIRDVRKDLSAPNLPFVIGVMGVGGPVDQYRPDQQRYAGVHQNFRDAMAAPAALPEFQGNVAAVLTEQYWDMRVVELREREQQIKPQVDEINQQVKDGKLTRDEGDAALDQRYAQTFTPQELVVLKESVSNADFHYMGSARILAPIGKAFAEAMLSLMQDPSSDVPTGQTRIPAPLPMPDGKPADQSQPVQVFILMGQSNMLGFGRVAPEDQPGTLEHLTKKEGRYPHLIDDQGNWTIRNDVHYVQTTVGDRQHPLTVQDRHIGVELQFGHIMGSIHEEPVLILKACIGNRSLGWDLLPPGSEQFEFEGKIYAGYQESPLSWDKGTTPQPIEWYAGKQYDTDTTNAKEVLNDLAKYYPDYQGQGYEVAGFVFWQGHKDQNAAHASRYEQNLVHFIKTLREDFQSPQAKFVLATIAFQGWDLADHGLTVANAQLAVSGDQGKYPEFAGNVKTVEARDFWRDRTVSPSGAGHHYNHNAETYMEVGNALGWAMADLLNKTRPLPH
jgi:hypothetical protein